MILKFKIEIKIFCPHDNPHDFWVCTARLARSDVITFQHEIFRTKCMIIEWGSK